MQDRDQGRVPRLSSWAHSWVAAVCLWEDMGTPAVQPHVDHIANAAWVGEQGAGSGAVGQRLK